MAAQTTNARKLTREEFAERVGCSVAMLRKIENDERRPSEQIADLMANSLDVPLEERSTFVQVARGELRVERIHSGSKPVAVPRVSSPKTNLPAFPTPLIGREREMEQLRTLLCNLDCPYGLKTSTEETKNKYPGFPTIYEQRSKLAMLEIWRVILKSSIWFH